MAKIALSAAPTATAIKMLELPRGTEKIDRSVPAD